MQDDEATVREKLARWASLAGFGVPFCWVSVRSASMEISFTLLLKDIKLDHLRWTLFSFRFFCRSLKFALAGTLLLTIASFPAAGQSSDDDAPQASLIKQLAAHNELNKGVAEYRKARYDAAIAHFQKAAQLDPGLLSARNYLGVALTQKVVPGLDTPENLKTAQRAIDIYKQLLDGDLHDVNAMKQIAGIDFSIKKLDDAKAWQKKILAENTKDPEAAYAIGVIDWTEAHQNVLKMLAAAGLNDDGEGNAKAPAEVMAAIKTQNGALIEEALKYLHQAEEYRFNYDDAMAYLDLIYRRKADLDWGEEAARKDDVAKAEEWRTKAMEARKANEEKRNAVPDSRKP
jgi:tetratricopeptide (TPR) repeat protein